MGDSKGSKGSKSSIVKYISYIIIGMILVSVLLVYMFFRWKPLTNMVERVTKEISELYSAELNDQMVAHIDSTIDNYYEKLDIIASTLPLVETLDEEQLRGFITDMSENERVSYMAFVDTDGFVYEKDATYLGTMKYHFLSEVMNNTEDAIYGNETIDGENYIIMGAAFHAPVTMGDKKLCAAIVGITNESFSKRVVMNSETSGGYSSIIERDGSYIVKNTNSLFSGLNMFTILKKNEFASETEIQALREAISANETYMLSLTNFDRENGAYLYFAPITDSEWYIVNCIPDSLIRGSVENLQNELIGIGLFVVLWVFLISSVIIVMLVKSRNDVRASEKITGAALREADRANKAKTSFLFNMSHDIRTPMNAILGYTDIAMNHFEDENRAKDSLKKIRDSGSHLLNLINDILEMSRIDSGRFELNEGPVDIRKAAASVGDMGRALAMKKDILMEVHIGDIRDPYIYADELHVNEVLINIISNAVKYTPNGGKVVYTINQLSRTADGKAEFSMDVTDNGIGMSEEFQKHLFETFSRENNTTTSKVEGTGLGLSIVKNITDMYGGTISVKSKQNEGTSMTVVIAFRVMDEEAIAAFEEENRVEENIMETVSLEGLRVLYVEDNELNREIGEDILTDAGMAVECAEDGDVAVDIIKEKGAGAYDVILMDIQMPRMNGYEATKAIRALQGGDKIPIIALSANAFKEDIQKSLSVGMNAHVPKPINKKVLFDTLQQILQK